MPPAAPGTGVPSADDYRVPLQRAHDVLVLLAAYRADARLPSTVRSAAETAHAILPSIEALRLAPPASDPEPSLSSLSLG